MPGLLSRLRAALTPPIETRDVLGPMSGLPGVWGIHGDAPGQISPTAAEGLAAVTAAVNAISSAVAGLQPLAFGREGAGRTELPPGHWLARLMRSPSARFSYPEWAEALIADCLLHGNALAEIVTDAGGRIIALEPIGWKRVTVAVLPSGRIAYDIAPPDGYWRDGIRTRRLLDDEVMHLRDRVDSGEIVARSRLSRAAGAVANVSSLQDMAAAVWANGVHSAGYLSTPSAMTKDLRLEAEGYLDRFRGAQRAGKTPLLPAGWKWESLALDAETAQTIESRRFGVYEVARVFGVPPPMLQSYEFNTFTNAEQASRWFGQFTVAPWARKVESCLARCVIGDPALSVELDLSSLLRGSDLERWQTHKIAVEIGSVGPEEIRQAEGWGPRVTPAPPAQLSDQQQEPTA